MTIQLTKEQQDRLLEWSTRITKAHCLEGVMPPGYTLMIHVSLFGHEAEAFVDDHHRIELGDVEVLLERG